MQNNLYSLSFRIIPCGTDQSYENNRFCLTWSDFLVKQEIQSIEYLYSSFYQCWNQGCYFFRKDKKKSAILYYFISIQSSTLLRWCIHVSCSTCKLTTAILRCKRSHIGILGERFTFTFIKITVIFIMKA